MGRLKRLWRRAARGLALALLLALSARSSPSPADYWRYAVDPFAGQYLFDWLGYETRSLSGVLSDFFAEDPTHEVDNSSLVDEYFALGREIARAEDKAEAAHIQGSPPAESNKAELVLLWERRAEIEDIVERVLETQVQAVLIEQGLTMFTPGLVFPPMQMEFETPPWLLVLSRRDRIETLDRISLRPKFPVNEVEAIEERADSLGISSLIVPTGGMSSYPPIVTEDSDLAWSLGAVIHEWVHNYLFFFPLGQHYSDTQETITMNETVASLVEQELSLQVLRQNYPELFAQRIAAQQEESSLAVADPNAFDFDAYMRETRLEVDDLLAQGKVEEAQGYMEGRRKGLEDHGIFIRKINQAYFAFYGTYATSPSVVSPIDDQLRELRNRSGSLADFLAQVSQMSSYEDLLQVLGE